MLFDFLLFLDEADADGLDDLWLAFFFSVLFCECKDDFFEDDADAVAPIATADGTFFAAVNDFFDDADADATFFDADADADADAEGLFAGIFLL